LFAIESLLALITFDSKGVLAYAFTDIKNTKSNKLNFVFI
jgi:hypothetical protein